MKNFRPSFVLILASLAASGLGQVSLGWASEYASSINGGFAPSGVFDSNGNYLVAGYQTKPSAGVANCALAMKYDRTGIQQWVQLFNQQGPASAANASCTDSAGNFYVCGQSTSAGDGEDGLIVKYDANGNALWSVEFDGLAHGDDTFLSIAVDDQGSVYASGFSYIDPTNHLDFLVAKYSALGQLQWSTTLDDPFHLDDYGQRILVDSNHNVYLGGKGRPGDIAEIAKFSSSGAYQWSHMTGITSVSRAFAGIEFGPNNTTYLAGTESGVGEMVRVIRFDSLGSVVFSTAIDPGAGHYATSTAVDPSGQVIVGMSSVSGRAVKLSLAGSVIWDTSDPSLSTGVAVAVEGTNTFLTGLYQPNNALYAARVDKLSSAGGILWTQSYPIAPGQNYIAQGVAAKDGLVASLSGSSSGGIVSAMYFENPVAVNDQYSVSTGSALNVVAASGLMANDSLALGASTVLVSQPANGTITLNADGSFLYIPAAGYIGNDTFTYKDVHGLSSSNVATVTISVQPALKSITLVPSEVMGGDPSTGTVTIGSAAPSGGMVINLSASSGVIQVPATVTIPSGQTTKTFTATTSAVDGKYVRYITATCNGISKVAALTLDKTVALSTLAVTPSTIAGGQNTTGTVTLNSAAPVGGSVVTLSDNTSVLGTPASVTVAAGAVSANFTITSSAVSSTVTRTVSAAYRGVTKNANVTLEPYYALTSLTLNPTTVKGGQSSVGTVTLTGPAPVGGEVVTLKSGSSVIHVPTSVTVLAGQTTATFTATTSQVAATVTRQISATYGTVTKVANLTITP